MIKVAAHSSSFAKNAFSKIRTKATRLMRRFIVLRRRFIAALTIASFPIVAAVAACLLAIHDAFEPPRDWIAMKVIAYVLVMVLALLEGGTKAARLLRVRRRFQRFRRGRASRRTRG